MIAFIQKKEQQLIHIKKTIKQTFCMNSKWNDKNNVHYVNFNAHGNNAIDTLALTIRIARLKWQN